MITNFYFKRSSLSTCTSCTTAWTSVFHWVFSLWYCGRRFSAKWAHRAPDIQIFAASWKRARFPRSGSAKGEESRFADFHVALRANQQLRGSRVPFSKPLSLASHLPRRVIAPTASRILRFALLLDILYFLFAAPRTRFSRARVPIVPRLLVFNILSSRCLLRKSTSSFCLVDARWEFGFLRSVGSFGESISRIWIEYVNPSFMRVGYWKVYTILTFG